MTTTLLAIGFPYPTTASAAAQDVLRLEPDLVPEPDGVAVVSCDKADAFHVITNHAAGQDEHRFFWHLLLTALIFLPGSGALGDAETRVLSRRLAALGLLESFQDKLREMLAPDTSALLLLAEQVPADALATSGRFGGQVLAVSLVPDVEDALVDALAEARGFTTPRPRTAAGASGACPRAGPRATPPAPDEGERRGASTQDPPHPARMNRGETARSDLADRPEA